MAARQREDGLCTEFSGCLRQNMSPQIKTSLMGTKADAASSRQYPFCFLTTFTVTSCTESFPKT